MARKKQEVALQLEIETQEEWEEMLAKEGLHVIDVYQEWCGPCKALLSNLKRLKNELGDDLLHFAVAKADTVDALDRYRGKCEPCFLFFAGGSLVSVLRGANAPLLNKIITEQLTYEHKVLDGDAERKEIRDPMFGDELEKGALDELETEEEDEVQKEVTVALIKPDVVKADKVDEVIEQLKEAGIEILAHEERQLTEEEAREFYSHKQEEEYFEDMVKFMTSGPSHVLVLTKGDTGENIINEFRDLLGPPSVEEAREIAPQSFRAKYGSENYVNALHASDSQETSMRELAFFFPSFVVPTVSSKPKVKPKIQRTLALIRPDALKDKKDEILAKIEESGFKVALQKEVRLTREQAAEFYKEHTGQEYFEDLIDRMTCGPVLALGLAREDAVDGWRDMLGPKEVDKAKEEAPQSLRAQFSVEEVNINQLHGSDSEETAQKELEFFFPMQQTIAAIKPDAYQTKEEIMDKIREAGFRIAARKETELSKDMAEQFYRDVADKEYFGDLVEHMTSGPTLFMVLSREDAVEGWRSIMGPTDPEKAKEENPNSIRATFGHDIKANAVHGSSNVEHAHVAIKEIFGEIGEGEEEGEKAEGADESAVEKEGSEKGGSRPGSRQSAGKEGSRPASAASKKDEGDEKGEDEQKPDETEATEGGEGTEQAETEQTEQEPAGDGQKEEEQTATEEQTTDGQTTEEQQQESGEGGEATGTEEQQQQQEETGGEATGTEEQHQEETETQNTEQTEEKKDDTDDKQDDNKEDTNKTDDDKKDEAGDKKDDKPDESPPEQQKAE